MACSPWHPKHAASLKVPTLSNLGICTNLHAQLQHCSISLPLCMYRAVLDVSA